MKRFLLLALAVGLADTALAKVSLEIVARPPTLSASAEVLGLRARASTTAVVVFTGKTARTVLDSVYGAGQYTYNETREIVVATGSEVDSILRNTVPQVAASTLRATEVIVVSGKRITKASLDILGSAARLDARGVVVSASRVVGNGARLAFDLLDTAVGTTVLVVNDAGTFAVKTTARAVGKAARKASKVKKGATRVVRNTAGATLDLVGLEETAEVVR